MQTPGDPKGRVVRLLDSVHVTVPTRHALHARLMCPPVTQPRYFDDSAFATLSAVCARLVPQTAQPNLVDVPGAIDTRLADGEGDGWRYATMPPDGAAHRLGLQGIDEVAHEKFQVGFIHLDGSQQDQILLAIQRGEVNSGAWLGLPSRLFFQTLLTGAAEAYFSHPLAMQEIGCLAMADADGWQAVGLEPHRTREPLGFADSGPGD